MAQSESKAGLPPKWLAELSDTALRSMAGDAVFARGTTYFHDEAVELVRDGGTNVTFEARGSRRYAVELVFEDPGLHVECTCPHAQDGNFCKHAVAAAMVWRRVLGGDDENARDGGEASDNSTVGDGPGQRAGAVEGVAAAGGESASNMQTRMAKAAQTRAAKVEALKTFLERQSAQALAQRLWEHAQGSRDLMAELKGWAASEAAVREPKALRQAVDELLKLSGRQYLEPAEVRAWIKRVDKAAQLLSQALAATPSWAAEVRAVAESALRQTFSVGERAYEHPGLAEDAAGVFMDVVVDSLRASPPPAAWAEQLLQRMQGQGGYAWQNPRVLEAAGPQVARAYSKRLVELWAQMEATLKPDEPMDTADMGFGGDVLRFDHPRHELRRWMVQDLERQGDPASVFSFLRRTARGLMEHAALIQWCDQHGRPRDALQLAQAACKAFGNNPRVEDLLLALYERDGWDDEALAIRQRRFQATPSPEHYAALVAAARRVKADLKPIREQAHERARDFEQQALQQQKVQARAFGPHWQPREPQGLNVSWRVGLHLVDGEFDQALQLVLPPHTCDPRVLETLADRLPASRDAEAFALLQRCFNFEMGRSKTPYREPLRLVAKALKRLNSQDGPAWLLSVGNTHRAKRNFIAGLPAVRA